MSVYLHRTISDWTSSNEKAVTALLHTLEELKSELSVPGSSQVRAAPPVWFRVHPSLSPLQSDSPWGRDLARCPGVPSIGRWLGSGAQGRCPGAPMDPACSVYIWAESLSRM